MTSNSKASNKATITTVRTYAYAYPLPMTANAFRETFKVISGGWSAKANPPENVKAEDAITVAIDGKELVFSYSITEVQ